MANNIVTIHADAGLDLYGILWHADGTVRDVVAGAWDTVLNADWGDYDIVATVAANGSYQVTFPAVAAGAYTLEIYSRLGETVSPYDTSLQRIPVEWDGSVILNQSDKTGYALTAGERTSIATAIGVHTTDGVSYDTLLECILAILAGVAVVTGSAIAFKKRDGTTTRITVTVGATAGDRTASVIA